MEELRGFFDTSWQGVSQSQSGPFGTEIILPSATVYSSQICRNSLVTYDKVIRVSRSVSAGVPIQKDGSRCNSLRTFGKIFLMCLRPQLALRDKQGSRRSEIENVGMFKSVPQILL